LHGARLGQDRVQFGRIGVGAGLTLAEGTAMAETSSE
jgi:hypothetical protein